MNAETSWLLQLTALRTAPGQESEVLRWIERWAERRRLRVRRDAASNLVVGTGTRSRRPPVVAVAHLDHPALVVTEPGEEVIAELRGGVLEPYVRSAAVEGMAGRGRVQSYDPASRLVHLSWRGRGRPCRGDILRWRFPASALGVEGETLRAAACDDLAGAAAALTALVRAQRLGLHHFSVLLTRAEEVGFIGAIAACQMGTISDDARIISIECSRSSREAPVGAGPIVRVGDASSVFSSDLTNHLAEIARHRQITHQRKLMAGGSCEATAFAAFGYQATGLCLALDNYHNMVDIDGVTAGRRRPRLAPEEISLSDYRGLVGLLVAAASDLPRRKSDLTRRLLRFYKQERHVLG